MSDPLSFYDLYCINANCNSSVFNGQGNIAGHLHVGSLLSVRLCPCCYSLLVSAMDIELEQITAAIQVRIVKNAAEIERLSRLN